MAKRRYERYEKYPKVMVDFTVRYGETNLEKFMRQLSEPSFDRWNNIACLRAQNSMFTNELVKDMIDFLNLPFAKDPTVTGTDDDNEEELTGRWLWVTIEGCRVVLSRHNYDYWVEEETCTLDDMHRLFSAISHRALKVYINNSPTVTSAFLSTSHSDHIEVDSLQIHQKEGLTPLHYSKLGDMIQQSAQLKVLSLRLSLVNGAHGLFAGLANAINLQELFLCDESDTLLQRKDVADLLVGDYGSNGPIMQLLRNPQNRLKKLSLPNIGLEDHHLIAILQMVPTSQIEGLDFSSNLIQLQGILEFAKLLPMMHSLKWVSFRHNHEKDPPFTDHDRNKVGEALLHGMKDNVSIEIIEGIVATPQDLLLRHYAALNRAGRRILASSQPIPDGLWPMVLEHAGKTVSYKSFDFAMYYNSYRYVISASSRAGAVYYFLQNCPKIYLSALAKIT